MYNLPALFQMYLYNISQNGVRFLHPWSHQLDCTKGKLCRCAFVRKESWMGRKNHLVWGKVLWDCFESAYLFTSHLLLNQTWIIFYLQEKHLRTGTAFKGFLRDSKSTKQGHQKQNQKFIGIHITGWFLYITNHINLAPMPHQKHSKTLPVLSTRGH